MGLMEKYHKGDLPIPKDNWAWFLYGAGLENFGRDDKMEKLETPDYGPDDLLARVDACGICFSDIKIIKAGPDHPRLFGRDMKEDPIIIGHEVALTVIGVGDNLSDQYKIGDRFVVQAEIYFHGKNLAFGYMLYGGFEQYVRLGDEVLRGDDGCYLIPIKVPEMGYAEAALAEPWACVVRSYRSAERRALKEGGVAWVIGAPDAQNREYTLGALAAGPAPATLILTDVPPSVAAEVEALAAKGGAKVCRHDGLASLDVDKIAGACGGDAGLDDVILLGTPEPALVEALGLRLGKGGFLCLVTETALAGPVSVDVGRVHYDQIRFIGCPGSDVSKAYSETRLPRLEPGGKFWVAGAGGPMGQMHVQWAIEQKEPPAQIIASDIDRDRLAVVAARFSAAAQARGIDLVCVNPKELGREGAEARLRELAPEGFDDICCLVPVPAIIGDCARYLGPRGMFNIFAGVGRGTMASIDVSPMALRYARFQGTSGSGIEDLELTLRMTEAGELNTNMSVAAICGLDGAKAGLDAVMGQRFPGKTVIYPQIEKLGLYGVDELPEALPQVAEELAPGGVWSRAAEQALLRKFLPAKYGDD